MSKDEQQARERAADVEMTDVDQAQDQATKTCTANKTKRKKSNKQSTLCQFTIRNPQWSYIHLCLGSISTSVAASPAIDALTVQLHLQSALSSFLGLHGTAIPFDMLKIQGQDVWIRVPREDASAVVAAVGGWVSKGGEGWRIKNWGCWGPDAGRDAGLDLFDT